jgi:hypothetical protein
MTAPADSALPKLWSVEKLSAHWCLKPDTIRAWARRGVLPSIRLQDKVMFREADLVAFLETRRSA